MAKNDPNKKVIQGLELELNQTKASTSNMRKEIDKIRNKNMILRDILIALVEDETYWSDKAKNDGTISRIKNMLENS